MPCSQKSLVHRWIGIWLLAALWAPLAGNASDQSSASDIKRVEAYLNSLRTVEARFIQNNPDGSYSQGKLFLHRRPGRLRLQYDPPVPLQLYANGNILIHVDTELEQVSHYPLDETPAHFLLRDQMSLSDGVTIKTFERRNRVIRIELVDDRNPDVGSVTLTLSEQPIELRSWSVTDSQGLKTDLALVDARFGSYINPNVFEFIDTFSGSGN